MSPVNFQVNELESFTNSFQASNLLGPGGFGNVYRGFILANNSHGLEEMNVVVKRPHVYENVKNMW